MARISKGMVGLLGEIVSLLHGAVASGLRLVNNLVSSGFKMAFQYNETAMAFSRQAGLTAKQAQAYTEVLTKRAKDLGEKYGIAAEEVAKLEQNLAKATGRVIMLNQAEAESLIQINRTVGEQTVNEFSQMMMRTMGGQFQTVQGAVSKAYATAAKSGLDAAGMAAKVGQNLGMANRLTFRNGVDGLTKMVALSEKLGFNVAEIENVANKFMDIQDAIENSAKLSMLGGAAGAFGGNPLDMAYEANNDPEALAERFTKALAGHSYFDENTLSSRMNAMSRDMVKGIAEAMGVSVDTAVGIAKKQAEIKYKNDRFSSDLNKYATDKETGKIDETRRDFFLNRTQMRRNEKTGQLELTLNGKSMDYYETDKGKSELAEMMRFQNMSDEEIVREQATAVVSIKDTLNGFVTSIMGTLAEKIAPYTTEIKNFIGDIYRIIKPHIRDIADNIKGLLATFFTKENLELVKSGITAVASAVMSVAKLITSNWWTVLVAAIVPPILGIIGWGVNRLSMVMGANNVGRGPGASGGAAGRGGGFFGNAGRLYNVNRTRYGNGRLTSAWNTINGRMGAGGMGASTAMKGFGAGLGLGLAGTGLGMLNDSLVENGTVDRGSVTDGLMKVGSSALQWGGTGLAIGSMFGPLGAAIGGGLGAVAGALSQLPSALKANEEKRQRDKDDYQTRPDLPKGSVIIPESHAIGMKIDEGEGAIPKNHIPQGDNALTWYNADTEGVYRKDYLATEVITKPVGGKEYIYTPQNQTNSFGSGVHKVSVEDINLKINGTVKLDLGGGFTTDLNELSQKLAGSRKFRAMMADIISEEFTNNGSMKQMMDTATIAGHPMPSYNVGKMQIHT